MRTLTPLLLCAGLTAMLPQARVAAQASDEWLAERAIAVVRDYPQFTIFDDVTVGVSDRTVTLTGRVTMPYKKDEIGARVARLDGVRRVVNEIGVLPVSLHDAALRTRAAHAIYTHPAFWHYASMARPPIHIIVERGRITLIGTVNSELERALAFALAQVDGAFEVVNRLRLDRR